MVVRGMKKNIRLTVLLGLLVVSGVGRLIWEFPRQPEYHGWWESQILKFEASDEMNPPPEDAILLVGSSSVGQWETAKQDLGPFTVFRRGFGGSCLSDVIHYANRIILPYRPSVVLVYAGDNDVAAQKTNDEIVEDFKALVETIQEELPDTRVGFLSIKPSLARWKLRKKIRNVNGAILSYARTTPSVDYIDISKPMLNEKGLPRNEIFNPDGLHLNRKGYQLWSVAVKSYLHRVQPLQATSL
mgnify:CR=1 FL=1|jgi:lysophospholipase L1-like esterase